MCHVQEIFDGPWPTGIKVIGAAMDFVESGVIPLWKCRDILRRITQRYPYPLIFLLSRVNFDMRGGRWFLAGMRWKADALPSFIVCPAMVWTAKGLVLNFAEGEAGAPVKAEDLPC